MILIGTGSEVQYVVAAQELLAEQGIKARVVSIHVGSGSTSRTRATGIPSSRPRSRRESRSRPGSASVGVTSSVTPGGSSASITTERARPAVCCSRSLVSQPKRSSQPHKRASMRQQALPHPRIRQPAGPEVPQT
ncbi:MAG TPA: hypothetical protein VJW23_08645 [Propionibacteriaceae bacterium]|nr:hypothetical protein [Propionibacteriaceae bacterium]